MMPVYASEVFAIGPTGLGLLMAVIGVGSTIGTIALASTRELSRRGQVLVVTIMLSCATMVGFSLADGLALAMTLLLLVSAVATVYWSLSEALVMEISPDHLRGRVASLAGASMGLFPLGSVIFGGIAEVRGPQTATFVAGLVMAACVGLLLLKFRQLWSFH